MKRNLLFVPLIAVVLLLVSGFVSAGQVGIWSTLETRFNDVDVDRAPTGFVMSGIVGDTVPVRVTFKAAKDVSDVKVKVYIEGHREEISASTDRFNVISGSVYTKLLTLELPSDLNDLDKDYILYVDVISANDRTEKRYTIRMQRESYTLDVLSVDYTSKVSAGDTVPVSVVVENNGFNDEEDVYVVASIPALGVSTRGYLGDLVTQENSNDEDEEDSREKVVYLKIPENAEAGVYDLEVEVYNDDADVVVKKLISVDDSESLKVFASSKSKDVSAGETVTYDLIIVNSADNIKVFNLDAVSGKFLGVSVPSIVTVSPESSETVSVTVDVSSDAEVGTYTFSVDVEGKQVTFGANVVDGASVSASVVALTVVLVIVFVVLLAVLIVLLTRKEKTIEEVETSYY